MDYIDKIKEFTVKDDIDGFLVYSTKLLESDRSYENYLFLYNQLQKFKSPHVNKTKISILRSFTIDQLSPVLEVESFLEGINLDMQIGDYNNFQQEILDNNSRLYRFNPDIVIIFARLEELCPELIYSFSDLNENTVKELTDYTIDIIYQLVKKIRSSTKSKIIICNFDTPIYPNMGIYDYQNYMGQINIVRQINLALTKMVNEITDLFILDFESYSALHGKKNIYDDNLWYYGKCPIQSSALPNLATEIVKYLKSLNGMAKKCIVLDLDNTLWGGVVGEDGLEGIQLGTFYPGNVYVDFQRRIRDLYNRGIMLAINSKNNLKDVHEVFENHKYMQLTFDHFISKKINWNSKADNIVEIAHELNIDLDSIVFIDDNPVEIEMVKQYLPQVKTIFLKGNPIENLQAVIKIDDFENLYFNNNDINRGEQYKKRMQAIELQNESLTIETFYEKLQMELELYVDDIINTKRISQLTQKTNQFNLTTKRYSAVDIEDFMNDNTYSVISLRLIDKFGDNGITGLAIIKINSYILDIDTFLLSCRIMGRTVEKSLLAYICEMGEKKGCKYINGYYIPTDKNIPVKDFYKDNGFELSEKNNGTEKWILDIEKKVKYSEHIKLR